MKKYGYIAFVLCVLAGCASQKQISYLQDVPDDYRQKITQDYDLRNRYGTGAAAMRFCGWNFLWCLSYYGILWMWYMSR